MGRYITVRQITDSVLATIQRCSDSIRILVESTGVIWNPADATQMNKAVRYLIANNAGYRNVYVSSTGNDVTNTGLSGDSAFASVERAIDYAYANNLSSVAIRLMSSITLTRSSATFSFIMKVWFYPDAPSGVLTMIFSPSAWALASDGLASSMRSVAFVDVFFNRVNVINQITAPQVNAVIATGGGFFAFSNATYSVISASARPFVSTANKLNIVFISATWDSTAGGRLLEGIASGANPNSAWNYNCNLNAL